MSAPSLNFRSVQYAKQLEVKNDVKVEIHSELCWSSTAPTAKTLSTVLSVSGTVKDKDQSYQDSWDFVWPDSDLGRLEAALRMLWGYVDQRPGERKLEMEVYSDVYDWLRVGWIDKDMKWHGYVEFLKDGRRLRAEVEDLPKLQHLRDILVRCLNQ